MAVDQGRITFALTAGATFSNSDLDKFIEVNSSGHAVIGGSTVSGNVVGTLLSVTGTTSGAGSEVVTVGALIGKGNVNMAASTLAAGGAVASSTNGLGIAPTTDNFQLGVIVSGSSGAAARKVTVVFQGGLAS